MHSMLPLRVLNVAIVSRMYALNIGINGRVYAINVAITSVAMTLEANNAIKTNNYNWKATRMVTNINIYWTVYYATIYLLNFKQI